MNYQKIYDQIIESAKTRELEVYKEKHHIIPKCIGGTNEKCNIVELTAREHFLCHWLLHEIYPANNKLAKAFFMMCKIKNNKQTRYIPSSRIIEYAKIKNSEARKNQKPSFKDKKHSIESIIKMSNSQKNMSKERKQKMSEAKKGRKYSDEHKNNMSIAKIGKKYSLEARKNMSEAKKGKPGRKQSEETKQKIANTQKIKNQLRKNSIIFK